MPSLRPYDNCHLQERSGYTILKKKKKKSHHFLPFCIFSCCLLRAELMCALPIGNREKSTRTLTDFSKAAAAPPSAKTPTLFPKPHRCPKGHPDDRGDHGWRGPLAVPQEGEGLGSCSRAGSAAALSRFIQPSRGMCNHFAAAKAAFSKALTLKKQKALCEANPTSLERFRALQMRSVVYAG